MFVIEGRVALAVYIDGLEFPVESSGFTHCHIVTNVRHHLPMLFIGLIDSFNLFKTHITLSDGAQVVVLVGRNSTDVVAYTFRLFSVKVGSSGASNVYNMYCYFDRPEYLQNTVKTPITGTANAALANIASICGFDTDLDPSNDKQTWPANNLRYCQYARTITERAYADDNSLFTLGITSQGKMRFKNVNTLDLTKAVAVQYSGEVANYMPIVDHRILTSSGFLNSTVGYAKTLVVQDGAAAKVLESVSARMLSQNLAMNKSVKDLVTNGHLEFSPIVLGNSVATGGTHDNYFKAKYQNSRATAIFSQGIEFMTLFQTEVDILDLAKVSVPQGQGMQSPESNASNPVQSGTYLITSKAIYVTGANYYEKYQGWTTGTNADPSGKGNQLSSTN